MRAKIISATMPLEVETRMQQELTKAETRGERLKEMHYSTAPAIVAAETKAIGDPPEDRAACWHNVLLIFE